MINEAVSVGVLTPTEIRQVIQGLTVSLLPPEEVEVLDPVSHRIKISGISLIFTPKKRKRLVHREPAVFLS